MQLGSSEWAVVERFVAAERVLREAGAAVPPAGLSPVGADQTMTCLIAIEKLAAGLRVVMAGQAAQTGSWRARGARSPEENLAKRTGTSVGKAKDTLKTSKRLKKQPKVEAALRDGTLSDTQAAAVSDAAHADSHAEGRLVGKAGETDLRGLNDECRKVKAAADPDPETTNRRIHNERYFRHGHDSEGAFTGIFRITPRPAPSSWPRSRPSAKRRSSRPATTVAASPSKRSTPTRWSPWPARRPVGAMLRLVAAETCTWSLTRRRYATAGAATWMAAPSPPRWCRRSSRAATPS